MAEDRSLTIQAYGAFLGKHSERLRVRVKGEVVEEHALMDIDHVLVSSSGITISTDLIRECCERGIPITFMTSGGRPYAKVLSPELTGTVRTRREQLLAYEDGRGVALAKAFVKGKLSNQASLIKYMAKYRKTRDPALYERLYGLVAEIEAQEARLAVVKASAVDFARTALMNIEGMAALPYWDAFGLILGPGFQWQGREGRGATDLVNSCLNYGYGILYAQVERAVLLAGLDPYAGFVHVDRPGKPSLVLDLIEEFRQAIVDRTVLALLNRGMELAIDDDGLLTEPSRKLLAQSINQRFEATEPYEGKKRLLRIILQSQARHIATYVRGEREDYKPFTMRW